MNRIEDRSIIFYTSYDPVSQQILAKLEKFPQLANQMELIIVHRPDGTLNPILPQMIQKLLQTSPHRVPILVAAGINNLIFGPQALSWIEHSTFTDYGGVTTRDWTGGPTLGSQLDARGNFTQDQLFQNSEYHLSGKKVEGRDTGGDLATIDQLGGPLMDLVEESQTKAQAGREAQRLLSQLKQQRSNPPPGPSQVIPSRPLVPPPVLSYPGVQPMIQAPSLGGPGGPRPPGPGLGP